MKRISLLFFALFFTSFIFSQNISNCNLNGNNERWESRWALPGTSERINDMIEGADGKIWATGDYTGSWGGEPRINGLITWDGERWTQVGGKFKCTSCGLGYRDALKMNANGNVFVGGFFEGAYNTDDSYVESSGLIKWDIVNQVWEAVGHVHQLNGARGRVHSIEIDNTTNTLYIGGEFDMIISLTDDTTYVSNIAALDLDNMTWSNLDGGVQKDESYVNGIVYALEMGADSTLYVAGGFTLADGQHYYSLAQWNNGSPAWSSVGLGLPMHNLTLGEIDFATAYSLLYDNVNDILYAGGTFGEYSGSSATIVTKSLAYFKNGVWTLISGVGTPTNTSAYRVTALALNPTDGHLFVGGTFMKHNGNNSPLVNLVGEWDPATLLWKDLDSGLLSGEVKTLVVKNNNVYAGGSFNEFSAGGKCNNFVAWDGTAWDNMGDGLNDLHAEVRDIELMEDGFIVAGNFSNVDMIEAERLARWRKTTGWESISLGLKGTAASNYNKLIYALHQEGDWLYIGGLFGEVAGGTIANGIAAYNLQTGVIKTWGTGLGGGNPHVNDMISFKGELYIAGSFTDINGVAIERLARLNTATDAWESVGSPSREVYKLATVKDSLLILTGIFDQVNGDAAMNRVAVFDGTNWTALGKGVNNGNVYDAVYIEKEDAILIGGSFTRVYESDGSISSIRMLAMFKNGQWEALDDISDSNSFREVNRLFYDEETSLVYVAGRFIEVDTLAINRIVRFDPSTKMLGNLGDGLDLLDFNAASASNTVGKVNFLNKQDGMLVLGGSFSSAGINQASSIARYELEDFMSQLTNIFPDSVAQCGKVMLDASAYSDYFQWSTGEDAASIEVTQSGQYAVTITTGFECENSDSIYVTIFENPSITFTGVETDSIAACDSIVITPDGSFVEWSWNNGVGFDNTFTARESAWVIFEGQDGNNCIGRDSVYVMIEGEPSVDFNYEIIEDSIFFFVINPKADLDYTWDFGNGATGTGKAPYHVYTENGTYQVKVSTTTNCGDASVQQEVQIDFVNSQQNIYSLSNFLAQPNPTSDLVFIKWQTTTREAVKLELLDMHGKIVLSKIIQTQANNDLQLNLSNLSNGLYLGRLSSETGIYSFKIVKH